MKKFHKINGYILRYKPNHPKAFTKGKAGKNGHEGYVYEHVLVAEKKLGRLLEKDEEVHHLDLVRSNNRPNNLIVILKSEHMALHAWLDKIGYTCDNVSHLDREYECIPRCGYCKFPIMDKQKHCSKKCQLKHVDKKIA